MFAKLLLIPILLFVEIFNINQLSSIFNFIFDCGLLGVILEKKFSIWKKAALIVVLLLILALIFIGNSIYGFDE